MEQKLKAALSIAGGLAAAAGAARFLLRGSRRIPLEGKVVLITGGSRGLGLVLAREFANRGARVAICARSNRESEHVRNEFADAGRSLVAETCDVGVRAEIAKVIESVREQLGEIDILVNNAGAMVVGPVENQGTETFEDALQTNFWGPFYAISTLLDRMKNRRFGRIVNVASIGAK